MKPTLLINIIISKTKAFFIHIWQIKQSELKLFLINAMILFCIAFNYTILRNLKDTLINTAAFSGPEVTCFIKSWLVLPLSIVCFICITKMSNIFSRENIFYIFTIIFLTFFFIFCFYLYPNIETIHPNLAKIHSLQKAYPSLQWVFPIYGIWSYSLFYIFAELWGSVMLSLLFWEYANEVTTTEEAKRFYPLFILLANIGLMMAGTFTSRILQRNEAEDIILTNADKWDISLQYITITIIAMGILAMLLYKWANLILLKKAIQKFANKNIAFNKAKHNKLKLNFTQSIKCIFSSPYLGLIAVLVISYGIVINLIEVVWKKQLAIYFSDPAQYCDFMSKFSFYTGLTTIITILLTKKIIQHSKWLIAALFTPLMLAFTGSIFFCSLFYKDSLSSTQVTINASLSFTIILIGAVQNVLSKSSKYALFDPAKEMTYIPLDNELKMKGKAAVDVVGERLGKASGGYIQQLLLITTSGSILSLAPILFILIFIVLSGWITSVFKLNYKYNALLKTNNQEAIPLQSSVATQVS